MLLQSYQKALEADSSYKPAAECLAIVLTDIGTSLKLAGNTHEGIQKYYEALKVDPRYAVRFSTKVPQSICETKSSTNTCFFFF